MSTSELWSAVGAALAAEDQAVFGYGLLGPYLPTTAEIGLANSAQAAHEQLVATTTAALIAAGQVAPPPAADYPALYPVTVGASALRLAVRLEQDAASAWRYVYAVAAGLGSGAAVIAQRRSAQAALTDSAVRAARWRVLVAPTQATVPFPGI